MIKRNSADQGGMETHGARGFHCPRTFYVVGWALLVATALSWCLYPGRSEAAAQPPFTGAPAIAEPSRSDRR